VTIVKRLGNTIRQAYGDIPRGYVEGRCHQTRRQVAVSIEIGRRHGLPFLLEARKTPPFPKVKDAQARILGRTGPGSDHGEIRDAEG
jgi:hypothetical protein